MITEITIRDENPPLVTWPEAAWSEACLLTLPPFVADIFVGLGTGVCAAFMEVFATVAVSETCVVTVGDGTGRGVGLGVGSCDGVGIGGAVGRGTGMGDGVGRDTGMGDGVGVGQRKSTPHALIA